MSAKKVSKYIRAQRKQARQEEKLRAKGIEAADPGATSSTSETTAQGNGTRVTAVLLAVGLMGIGVTSAVVQSENGTESDLATVGHLDPEYVMADEVETPTECMRLEHDVGLFSEQCSIPYRSQVFLGPHTGAGASAELVLSNPYSWDATVEVSTIDTEGDRGALGATSVLVPAESQESVNLATLADDEANIAVQVISHGAPVHAHLSSSRSTGNPWAGTEMLPGMVQPVSEHVVTGVPVAASADDTGSPQLWFYVPDSGDTTVELQVFGPSGQIVPDTPGVFSIGGAEVSVVDLQGIDQAALYDLVIRTDQPAYVAVRTPGDGTEVEVELEPETDPFTGEELEPETEMSPPEPDMGWAVSGPALAEGASAQLPTGADHQVHFFNAGPETAGISVDVDGEEEQFTLEPGAALTHDQLYQGETTLEVTEVTGLVHSTVLSRSDTGEFTLTPVHSPEPGTERVPVIVQAVPGRVS